MVRFCKNVIRIRELKHTEYRAAPWRASSTTWIVALSPALTDAFTGNGTWGRHMVPGYGFLLGPMIWNGGTIEKLMFLGPALGPSVPKPRLTYKKAVEWPWNQPGWKATAPPVVGQYVLLVVVFIPPPGQEEVSVDAQTNRHAVAVVVQVLTWIHPLHSKRKLVVRFQVISSPARIGDNCVGRHQRRAGEGENY